MRICADCHIRSESFVFRCYDVLFSAATDGCVDDSALGELTQMCTRRSEDFLLAFYAYLLKQIPTLVWIGSGGGGGGGGGGAGSSFERCNILAV